MKNKVKVKKIYDWWGGGSDPYDAAVQSVIDRATTLGYTIPDATKLTALSNFVAKRRTDGSLALMDLLKISALNDTGLMNFATLNYIDPTKYQSTRVNGITYGVRGFTPDGVSTNISDNYNPATNGVAFTQNSASFGVYITVAATIGAGVFGYNSNSTGIRILLQSSTQQRVNAGSNLLNSAVDMSGSGYRAVDRIDSGNVSVYNLNKNDRTQTSAAIISDTIVGGKTNTAFSDAVVGLTYIASHLSETQHNNIKTDFGTYLTEIGL